MLTLLAATLVATSTSPWAYVAPAMVKVRPGAQVEHRAAIDLVLGRGECQAAQVVIDAGPPIFDLDARAQPLAGPDHASLALALSREAFLQIQHPSDIEGQVGPWPDILIPAIDPIAHEVRRAFPINSTGGLPTVIWAEVCAPEGAAPGVYRGALTVSARHRADVALPVHVRVLHYALPATSSFPTAFGFSGRSAARAHGMNPDDPAQVQMMIERYAKLALMYRISLFGLSMDAPPYRWRNGKLTVDFSAYDREVGPLLDGSALASGAKLTALDLRMPSKMSDADRTAYVRETVAHLKARGWLGRLFFYAPDEPPPSMFAKVRELAALAHRADPKVRVLVTASTQPGLAGVADLWTPNIVCLFPRPEGPACPAMAPLAAYAPARARGAKLWWYQSCMSHGCGPAVGRAAKLGSGWPAYIVDLPASLNRAMGAAAYRFGIQGELYYSTTEAYDGDPWQSVWRFDGNGDGTLFYPGRPARIGGHTEIPLASLRLAYLRMGLQDLELMRLAASLGLEKQAMAAAVRLVPKAWEIERDPSVWQSERTNLALAVDRAWTQRSAKRAPRSSR